MDFVLIYSNDKNSKTKQIENWKASNLLNYDELIGIIRRRVFVFFVILIAQFHGPLIASCANASYISAGINGRCGVHSWLRMIKMSAE